jgi:hypothetical protein
MWNTVTIQYSPLIEEEWDEHFKVSFEKLQHLDYISNFSILLNFRLLVSMATTFGKQ